MRKEDVTDHDKGAIGEAIIKSKHGSTPKSLKDKVSEILHREHPELMEDADHWSIQQMYSHEGRQYFFETEDGEDIIWRVDAYYKINISVGESEMENPDTGRTYMLDNLKHVYFPVEVKTGPEASRSRTQKEAMQMVSEKEKTHPLLIRISLDGMPEQYTIEVEEI